MTTPNTGDLGALTIDLFCAKYSISRNLYYKMVKDGTSPKVFYARSKPLISIEAAEAWVQRMEKMEAEKEAPRTAAG